MAAVDFEFDKIDTCNQRGSIYGMSGVIYAFWGYLIVYGFVRRKLVHIFISLATLLLYGGLIYGVLPTQVGVSFESHLLGALAGALSGYYFAKPASRYRAR